MKQTAVDWLLEQFEVSHSYINEIFKETIDQAKAMEKEQIMLAHLMGFMDIDGKKTEEEYYNETYGIQE
jgi:hypothetical protein